ncbi:hypothetical protein ACTFIW_005423 [Dictyostelium discoideum]
MGRRKRNTYLLKSKVKRIYNDLPKRKRLVIRYITWYKHMVNNQGLLVEEELNDAPFGTPEGITVSSTVKKNDTDLLIIEKRINDSLKPLLLMSSMLSSDSYNADVELISILAQSAIVLSAYAQLSLSCVRLNKVAKEIYGTEYTPKMFDETETELVRKLAKSIRKNNEGNSSNSKSNSGSNGPSNNFTGSPSNVVSGRNNTKSLNEEQEVHLPTEIIHWLTVLNQWNGKEISLFPNYDYFLTTDASESTAGASPIMLLKMRDSWHLGGPASHGSGFHRHAGYTGTRSTPGRCLPEGPSPSHMGDVRITVQSLKVFALTLKRGLSL